MDHYQLVKYFENKCSPTEVEEIEKWLKTSAENEKLFQDVKKIWETAEKAPDKIHLNYKKAWEKIQSKTGIKDRNPRQILLNPLLKIAAALIILVVLSILIKLIYFGKPDLITETNQSQTQKELHLSDGTTVILNRNSQLIYPEHFDQKTRNIVLGGEAFFKVAKDSLHPFIVHAGGTIIRVLGTSFNINGKDTARVVVSVLEGSVAFKPENIVGNLIQLNKGERGIFEKQSKTLNKTQITDENFLSWKTGILSFNNQKLGEAVKILSEYYSRTIEVQPELQDRVITVTFNNQPLNEVLEILEMTLHIKIDSKPDRILLRTSNNN